MSSRTEFDRLRNQVSILLAVVRRTLAPKDFQILLRLQWLSDGLARQRDFLAKCPLCWDLEVRRHTREALSALERGQSPHKSLGRLRHLYLHLIERGLRGLRKLPAGQPGHRLTLPGAERSRSNARKW